MVYNFNNPNKMTNFGTEQVYAYDSEKNCTDIDLPYSKVIDFIHKFFINRTKMLIYKHLLRLNCMK